MKMQMCYRGTPVTDCVLPAADSEIQKAHSPLCQVDSTVVNQEGMMPESMDVAETCYDDKAWMVPCTCLGQEKVLQERHHWKLISVQKGTFEKGSMEKGALGKTSRTRTLPLRVSPVVKGAVGKAPPIEAYYLAACKWRLATVMIRMWRRMRDDIDQKRRELLIL